MKPSFASTVHALTLLDQRYVWVEATPDEAEVASVLAEIEELHQGSTDLPDERGRYGRCRGCLESWPCAAWNYGDQLAVQWLGRAADRVYAHAQGVMAEQDRNRRDRDDRRPA